MALSFGGEGALKILYTNTDQFPNKRDDLSMLIAGDKPDEILLTEVIPRCNSILFLQLYFPWLASLCILTLNPIRQALVPVESGVLVSM